MKKIKFEDKFCFISNGVGVKNIPSNYRYGITNDATKYVDEKVLYPLCRLIMLPVRLERIDYIADYLFWFEKIDLVDLDLRFESSTYNECDFEYSVITSFIPNVRCRSCYSVFAGALMIENSMFMYIYRNWKTKIEQLKKLNIIKECPVCGGSFGIKVVKIFR